MPIWIWNFKNTLANVYQNHFFFSPFLSEIEYFLYNSAHRTTNKLSHHSKLCSFLFPWLLALISVNYVLVWHDGSQRNHRRLWVQTFNSRGFANGYLQRNKFCHWFSNFGICSHFHQMPLHLLHTISRSKRSSYKWLDKIWSGKIIASFTFHPHDYW